MNTGDFTLAGLLVIITLVAVVLFLRGCYA